MGRTTEHTLNELFKRFKKNNWQPIELHMKCGDQLTLTACTETMQDPATSKDITYILVEGSEHPFLDGSPTEVADNLNRYENLLDNLQMDRWNLRDWYERLIAIQGDLTDEQWDWFSDCYKGLYGKRPKKSNPYTS